MNYLAIETSGDVCSVALEHDGAVVHRQTDEPRAHAASVAPFIQELLSGAGIRPDAVVVVAGPGSYTGLRIGVSSAKGLCTALDIPLYAVSSLLTAAEASECDRGQTVVIERARRGELYVGAPGRAPDTAITDEEFPEWLAALDRSSGREDVFLSRDPDRLGPDIPVRDSVIRVAPTALHALSVVHDAPETYLVGDRDTFEPYYLKAFVARAASGSVFDRLPFGGS